MNKKKNAAGEAQTCNATCNFSFITFALHQLVGSYMLYSFLSIIVESPSPTVRFLVEI